MTLGGGTWERITNGSVLISEGHYEDGQLVLPGNSRRRQLLDEFLQKENIKLDSMIELPDSKFMGDFVNNNDYIGYFVEEEDKYYGLVKLQLREDMPTNAIGLIYFKNMLSVPAKKFVELVLEDSEK